MALIQVPEETAAKLRQLAEEDGVIPSHIVVDAIDNEFAARYGDDEHPDMNYYGPRGVTLG